MWAIGGDRMSFHQIHIGDIIDVTITGIQPYGAFALLPDHSSGLIHISEISDRFVRSVGNYVSIGETIKVKVIDIDPKTHQAKLSLKAVVKSRRKCRRHRQLIVETPKGFQPLKEMLPRWISRGINKEEDV
jgi:predicted RNA-binding protein with RPS1 domain